MSKPIRVLAAIGTFILSLDVVAMMVAFAAAAPSTRDWVLPLTLIAMGSAGLVLGTAAAVVAYLRLEDRER